MLPLFVLDPALWGPAGHLAAAYLGDSLRALDAALRERQGGAAGCPGGPRRPGTPGGAGRPGGRRRAGARRRRLRALRPPPATRRRRGAGRARHRAGPHRLAVRRRARPGDQGRRDAVRRVHAVLSRAWPAHGWRGPVDAAARRALADRRRHHRHPRPRRCPTGSTLPDGRRGGAPGAAGGRSSTSGSPTTTATGTGPASPRTSHMSVHLKWGEIHPRTMLADLSGRRGQGATTYRSELAWREFYADVLHQRPDTARDYLRPEFARMAYDEPGRPARARGSSGRTGFPSSTPGCGSCGRPAGCTTGCG